ncbi:MAG TPA: hypothetical protein VN253_20460 [Kofleriaceae bacterium]|nr:hypothetical protein [Kofleriaceae bacterium]
MIDLVVARRATLAAFVPSERELMATSSSSSGELTLKQAGIMLLVIAAGLIGAELGTGGHWTWGGIPVIYIAGAFAALGLVLTIVGFVKKA